MGKVFFFSVKTRTLPLLVSSSVSKYKINRRTRGIGVSFPSPSLLSREQNK